MQMAHYQINVTFCAGGALRRTFHQKLSLQLQHQRRRRHKHPRRPCPRLRYPARARLSHSHPHHLWPGSQQISSFPQPPSYHPPPHTMVLHRKTPQFPHSHQHSQPCRPSRGHCQLQLSRRRLIPPPMDQSQAQNLEAKPHLAVTGLLSLTTPWVQIPFEHQPGVLVPPPPLPALVERLESC